MFGKKKKNTSGIADDLFEFLEEADARYIKAFETRSIGILKDYFTRDCCLAISRWIVADASSRYFSDQKLRTTTWTILNESDTSICIMKDVVYHDIRLTVSRTMKVSEDYREEWRISVMPDEFFVTSVSLMT